MFVYYLLIDFVNVVDFFFFCCQELNVMFIFFNWLINE